MKIGKDSLEARVLSVMRAQRLASTGDTVLVAVSGGADSIALLHLLCAVQGALGIRLACAHYEHGIRGEASREDAAFVRAQCEGLGVPFYPGEGDVPALKSQWRCSLEDAARRARYAFLKEAAAQAGASRVALAHQQEDQAETLLLHLVHGAGLRGLSAMRPRRGMFIRPLLDIPRVQLVDYLRGLGIPWREDATNADEVHARNLLRLKVFPLLRTLNPQASEAMARTARQAAAADAVLGRLARAALDGRMGMLPYGAFWRPDAWPPLPEAVRLFADIAGVPPLSLRATDAVMALEAGETANLPGGWRALRTRERLHLLCPEPGAAPPLADTQLGWAEVDPTGALGDGIREQLLDLDALDGAVLRYRMPGDRFGPPGIRGTQKLKETLAAQGVDRPFRDLVPLLACGNRVLWIIGVRPARDALITGATRRAVRLTYRGALPWVPMAGLPDMPDA